MFVDMIVFSWLAIRYKSIPLDLLHDSDEKEKEIGDEETKKPLEVNQ
jgi:hypothetical protein